MREKTDRQACSSLICSSPHTLAACVVFGTTANSGDVYYGILRRGGDREEGGVGQNMGGWTSSSVCVCCGIVWYRDSVYVVCVTAFAYKGDHLTLLLFAYILLSPTFLACNVFILAF